MELVGSARERGLQHGRLLAAGIRRMVGLWRDHVGPRGADKASYLATFRAAHRFRQAIANHAPQLMEELLGIAAGSDLPLETILDLQLLDEEWWFRQQQRRAATSPHHCSALAGRKDGGVIVAQNFDGVSWMAGLQLLQRHRDPASGLDALVLTLPGLLALNGVNRAGVAVCVNSLVQLDGSVAGLPVAAVIRQLLEMGDYSQARRFVLDAPHASGQNYVIGDTTDLGMFEASAASVREIALVATRGALWHTNHPLANEDRSAYLDATRSWTTERIAATSANTLARYACLERHLVGRAALDVESVKLILSSREDVDHPVSRELGLADPEQVIDYTVACTIFELGPDVVTHYAPGPPSLASFSRVDLGPALTVGRPC